MIFVVEALAFFFSQFSSQWKRSVIILLLEKTVKFTKDEGFENLRQQEKENFRRWVDFNEDLG